MHVLLVAQSATARALGGPEVREQFAIRILAGYSMNAWRMLAPEIHPAPKPTKHPGRAQVVIGGTARETQVLFFTDAEAREWATSRPPASKKKPPAVPATPAPAQLPKPADNPQVTLPDNRRSRCPPARRRRYRPLSPPSRPPPPIPATPPPRPPRRRTRPRPTTTRR
ncbi:hypothetical protein ACWEWI_25945 [Streptomyces sp. NPDC003753]